MRANISIVQWLFVVISLVFIAHPKSQVFAEAEKFSLSKAGSATAVVSSKAFDVTVDVGKPDGYPDSTDSTKQPIKFELIIGEKCKYEITGIKKGSAVEYTLELNKDSNLPDVKNLNKITVTDKKITFDGSTSNGPSTAFFDCDPDFKGYPGDDSKYLIKVELKGDVPGTLVLSSSTVDMYGDPAKDGKEDESTGFPGWAIGLIAVVVVAILIGVGAVLAYFLIKRKKAKEAAKEDDKQKKDGKEKTEEEEKTAEAKPVINYKLRYTPLPGTGEKSSSIKQLEPEKPDKSQKVIDKVDANVKGNAGKAPLVTKT